MVVVVLYVCDYRPTYVFFLITFCARHICLSVPRHILTLLHYSMDPDVSWGNGRG